MQPKIKYHLIIDELALNYNILIVTNQTLDHALRCVSKRLRGGDARYSTPIKHPMQELKYKNQVTKVKKCL